MNREKEWALIIEEANTKLHSLLKLSVINEINKLVVKTEVQNLIGKTEQDLKSKKAPQDLIAKTIKSIKLRFVEWFQRIAIILSKHTANPLIDKTYQALTGKKLKGSNSLLININDTDIGGINEVSDFVTTQTHAAGQAYMDDYTNIVKKAMKEIASKNLVMRDKNGRKLSVRNLAEMTARYQDTQDKLQELKNKNISFVVASSHANASKRCQIWQGKVFLLDVEPNTQFKQEVIEGYEPTPLGKIDNINYYSLADAMRHGFLGYNCRHRLIKYTKGMELFREYPVNQIERERNIESKQRNLERQIRRAKQNASMAITKEERQKWTEVSKYYQDKYHDFCHSNGVVEVPWRTRISRDERGVMPIIERNRQPSLELNYPDEKYIIKKEIVSFDYTKFTNFGKPSEVISYIKKDYGVDHITKRHKEITENENYLNEIIDGINNPEYIAMDSAHGDNAINILVSRGEPNKYYHISIVLHPEENRIKSCRYQTIKNLDKKIAEKGYKGFIKVKIKREL